MSVPGIVQSTLNGEEIAARVSIGGEDELYITPSSTLVYRSEGLLSDESVNEFPHEADRLTLSEARRKTKFTLEYALEGTKTFAIPAEKTDDVLHLVLAGVLNGNGITEPTEAVIQTYRFSELTLVVTSERLVKHIGAAVWDDDYEVYHFGDVTNLAFEDGSVATQVVLSVDGRPQRIKAPNEEANDLRERLKRALFEYHDVGSLEELNSALGGDEAEQDRRDAAVDFSEGVGPLDANQADETDDPHDADAQAVDPLADESAAGGTDVYHQSQSQQRADAQRQPQTSVQADPESDRSDETAAASDSDRPRFGPAEVDPSPIQDDHDPLADSTSRPETESDSSPGSETEAAPTSDIEPELESEFESEDISATELVERVEALEAAVDKQTELLEHQQRTIQQLIDELRTGR